MRFSQRSSFDLSENDLARALRERSAGGAVLDLTEANPTRSGFSAKVEALEAALSSDKNVHYAPDPRGYYDARVALSEDLEANGHHVPPERLLLTASTSEAYTYLFKLLCDPGDEILIPAPSYPLFDYLAQLEGITPVTYPLGFEGTFFFDAREVAARVTPETRAIVLVSPNNPTGTYLRADTLEALLELDVPLLSDEVFERYALARPVEAISATTAQRGLTFSLFGLSKQAALPQLKLAWTAVSGDAARVEAALARLELIGDSLLSVNTPVMNGTRALLAIGDGLRAQIMERARANVAMASAIMKNSAITPLRPEGGVYLVLRIPHVEGDLAAAVNLLETHAVHVHPGTFFGFPRGAHFVVSLLTDEATFREGLTRIRAFFDADVPSA